MLEFFIVILLILLIISLLPLDAQAKNIAYVVLLIVVVLKLFHIL